MIPQRHRASFLVGIAATAIAAASYGALSILRGAGRVRRFSYNIQPLSEGDYSALGAQPGWRAVGLAVGEAVRLRGLERETGRRDAPRVLFFTGNDAHPLAEGQHFIDALRADHDWGGVVWAYRGFDGSAGEPTVEALENDAWEQYRHLMDESPGPVHLVGFSLGTNIAAYVAARAVTSGLPPSSVTLLAPFTEIDMQLTGSWTRHRYATLKYLDHMTPPVLVVHGSRDDVLPVEGGRLIATKLGARYVEHADLKHLDLANAPAVLHDVRAFIEEHSP